MALKFQNKTSYIFHSNALDNVVLSEQQTAEILASPSRFQDAVLEGPGGKEVEAAVVLGHDRAIDYVCEEAGALWDLTEDAIKKMHQLLMEGVLLSAGEYRECTLRSKGIPPFSPQRIPQAMKNLVKYIHLGLERAKNKEELAWQVHHRFLTIHPFIEGNGRLARLLLNYIRLRCALPELTISVHDQPKYVNSILKFQEHLAQVARAQQGNDEA